MELKVPNGVEKRQGYITINFPEVPLTDFVSKMELGKATVVMRHPILSKNGSSIHFNGAKVEDKEDLNELIKFWNDSHGLEEQWTLKTDEKEVLQKNLIRARLKRKFDVTKAELLGKGRTINGIRVSYVGENKDAKTSEIQASLRVHGIQEKGGSRCAEYCVTF